LSSALGRQAEVTMSPTHRLPLPLLVLGIGLVVAGLRSGPVPVVTPAATPLAYAPPAAIATATVQPRIRVAPTRHRRAHTAAHAATAAPRRSPRPPRPVATHASTPVAHATVVRHRTSAYVSGPTHWSALNAAIVRIPTYRPGAARWVVSSKYDFWGTADWYHDVLYVAPGVPVDKLYDVAVHEWSHELSVLDYRGDVAAATRAMNAAFGGSGLTGPERAADCMAILQGAGWTHYTTCTDATWRAAAARLVAGKPLV
jgi:hypothetical protein